MAKNQSTGHLSPCRYLNDSYEDPENLYVHNLICSVLNCLFMLPGICGNVLIILAVWKTPSLQTPSNGLLLSLATSDLAVGLLAQPSFSVWRISQMAGDIKVHCVAGVMSESFGWLLAGVSLFTITAISCERFLAVHLHLRKHDIVTRRGIAKVVLSFWLTWILIIVLRFFIVNRKILRIIAVHFLVLTSAIMFMAYIMIFKLVRRHQMQIQRQCFTRSNDDCRNPGNKTIDMVRYKRSTITMLYILGFFLLCYFPFLVVMLVEIAIGETLQTKVAYLYTVTSIFINSAVNPLIYCWRMKEIRMAIMKIINSVRVNAIEPERSRSCVATKRHPSIELQIIQHHSLRNIEHLARVT
ncbi:beta-3 adrenergic receptor-like [Stylophora pistillata]|uniref:beta-3 adrenergic receptor-like n=1 Tax=Stylophora pistillata TaxID=50429 RepID=UPI000C047893|nr:beta-3 adrenergic receptor-like [Stylophora pistillata]